MALIGLEGLNTKLDALIKECNVEKGPQLFSLQGDVIASKLAELVSILGNMQDDKANQELLKDLKTKITKLEEFVNNTPIYMKVASAVYNFFLAATPSVVFNGDESVLPELKLEKWKQYQWGETSQSRALRQIQEIKKVSGLETLRLTEIISAKENQYGEIPPILKFLFQQRLFNKIASLFGSTLGKGDTSPSKVKGSPDLMISLAYDNHMWQLKGKGVFCFRDKEDPEKVDIPSYEIDVTVEGDGQYMAKIKNTTSGQVTDLEGKMDTVIQESSPADYAALGDRQAVLEEFIPQIVKDNGRNCQFMFCGEKL